MSHVGSQAPDLGVPIAAKLEANLYGKRAAHPERLVPGKERPVPE